ncbi:MAG: NAD(P)/FAD-dependent oxidoreductase, partial [Bacteroidota bacterium]
GDSALDWTIYLADMAEELYLVHRRREFRGALDSVEKVAELAKLGKVKLLTDAQVVDLEGQDKLAAVVIKHKDKTKENTTIPTDHFVPLFGLAPKLGPIGDWGLEIEKNAIKVNNALDYQTNIPGVYAIGDVNTYPGKLKLILSGFHEAAVMCQFAYKVIHPNKKFTLKYTTVGGVQGFDGTVKEAKKAVVKAIS